MNKRPFMAVNWLSSNSTSQEDIKSFDTASSAQVRQNGLPALPIIQTEQKIENVEKSNGFELSSFIIPQWKGESLATKDGQKLKKLMKSLLQEAKEFTKTFNSRNKSTKLLVYNEFISFAECENTNISNINDMNQFWDHFTNPHSEYRKFIDRFLGHYSILAINTYLLKLRFICLIANSSNKTLSSAELLNPDYTISKLFKKSSSTELVCDSLKTNVFSWFRPSEENAFAITDIAYIFKNLSTLEFLKICNHEFPIEMGYLLKDSNEYSHSISNRNFGLFVNNLLINFPQWLEGITDNQQTTTPKCLNTLFSGDQLYSYALSHWSAQENNINEKWSQIICPEFSSNAFQTSGYVKLCQELQFLTFLVTMANAQKYDPILLICKLYKQKAQKSESDPCTQLAFLDSRQGQKSIYDRIVLNLSELPKTNPHHFVLTSLQNFGEKLSNDGYLYIFSNQKLFVPSHSDKIESVLKRFKLHASFEFENLKGRGEIAKYLYVVSKRIYTNNIDIINSAPKLSKESCLTFNFQGALTHFSKFDLLRVEFKKFLALKESINSPLYQKEPESGIVFDFHQDAILNGKLLSNSNDSNNITHPSYFKNLTRTCIPFDQFFIVEQLTSKFENFTSELLGVSVRQEQQYQYLLIVNYTNEDDIKVELTLADLFKVKSETYGHAYFQYFGLTPKVLNLNINLFREYFGTAVGRQVIQLTFNGGLKKTKSKLKAMLIPKFISNTEMIPSHHRFIENFAVDKNTIKGMHPTDLMERFSDSIKNLNLISNRYPWHSSCLLSHFKYQLEEFVIEINANKGEAREINYNNPLMVNELVALKKFPIYPSHEDLFIEAKFMDRNDVHKRLSSCNLVKTTKGYQLNLFCDDKNLISLHGDFEILHFTSFILQNAINATFASILQSLELPKANDLKVVFSKYSKLEECATGILKDTQAALNAIIIHQVFKSL